MYQFYLGTNGREIHVHLSPSKIDKVVRVEIKLARQLKTSI